MFVTDRLIFLQMRKTACTHIARLLAETIGGEEVGYKHSALPDKFPVGSRQIVGSIRNPWDYYISSWAYGIKNREDGLRKRITTRHYGYYLRDRSRWPRAPRGLFNTLTKPVARWETTYGDPDDAQKFRQWMRLMFNPRRKFDNGEPYGFSPVANFAGLMTFRYVRLFWRDRTPLFDRSIRDLNALRQADQTLNQLNAVIRNESLEADFVAALQQAGYQLNTTQITKIEQTKRTNTSKRRALDHYYDEETIALVAKYERFIIEKYGYQSPQPSKSHTGKEIISN